MQLYRHLIYEKNAADFSLMTVAAFNSKAHNSCVHVRITHAQILVAWLMLTAPVRM